MNRRAKDNMKEDSMLDLERNSIKNIIDIFNDCIPDNGKCNCEYVEGLSVEEYLQMKRGVMDE